MARRPLPALFLRARDEASTGRRAAVVGVVLLAAVHGFVVAPAVEEERRSAARRVEAAARAELWGELEAMAAEVARMGEESRAALAPIVARLEGDLERDLERLTATVAVARTATAEGGEEATEPLVADPGAGVAPLELDDPEALFALREATDPAALVAVLAPIVDAEIVRPRFEAATRELREAAGTRLRVRCDGLATKLPRLRSRLPGADEDWDALVAAVGALRRQADELTIEPPRREGWWRRAAGPLALGLDDVAAEQVRAPLAADELGAGLARVEAARAKVAARLAPEAAVSDERLGGLRQLVPPFPLVLGLALGGLLAAAASRVRELGIAVRLLLDDGGPLGLRAWLFARLAPGQPLGASAQTARRLAFRRSLAVAAAAAAWVLQAGAHVAPLTAGSGALLPVIGLVAVIAGAVVHRRALGDALGLFAPAEPREPAPAAAEPSPRPEGVVAGQDLAR